jgi:hypothetical protein
VAAGADLAAVAERAAAAEAHGLAAVLVEAPAGVEALAASVAATATAAVRLAVVVRLDAEHPVTLAEEIAVVDNVSGGRVVAVADPGTLTDADAIEAVAILEQAWSGRPVRHAGRWTVPAGLRGHQAPDAVVVTPPPAQLEVPVWLTRPVAGLDRPVLTTAPAPAAPASPRRTVPGRAVLSGDLQADRELVQAWAVAGTSVLFVEADDLAPVSGRLAPEVAMVGFPSIIVAAPPPAPWPGA